MVLSRFLPTYQMFYSALYRVCMYRTLLYVCGVCVCVCVCVLGGMGGGLKSIFGVYLSLKRNFNAFRAKELVLLVTLPSKHFPEERFSTPSKTAYCVRNCRVACS